RPKKMAGIPLFRDGSVKTEEDSYDVLLRSEMGNRSESPMMSATWEQEMEMDLAEVEGIVSHKERAPVAPKLTDARSARADFVFDLANLYLAKIHERETIRSGDPLLNMDHCRKSLSFVPERNQMWIKVTERCNVRFGEALGTLNVEQIKKIFGNRLARPKKNHIPSRPEDLLGLPSASVPIDSPSSYRTPDQRSDSVPAETPPSAKKIKLADSSTASTSVSDRVQSLLNQNQSSGDSMESLMRAFDRSDEITGLKEQLIEKDKEIDRLKKLIIKMSDSHLHQMDSAMDMFKKALRDQTAQDIINALQIK
ncbi:hypothetical protein PFISCL1PPCAC_9929, partial [Pristionchus fissidentatus]